MHFYVSLAWWGLHGNAFEKNRIEAFLRRAGKVGYYNSDVPVNVDKDYRHHYSLYIIRRIDDGRQWSVSSVNVLE